MSRRPPPLPCAPLRLRDAGLTSASLLAAVALSLATQLGTLGFSLLLLHVMDGVVEARNGDTLIGFALLFGFAVVVSGLYTHLRGALLAAAGERLGLRLQAGALQAAIRNAVRTDSGQGLSVLQDIAQIRRFLGGGAPTAFLDLIGAAVCLGILFQVDAGLGLVVLAGIGATTLLGFVMYRATRRLVAESQKRFLDTSAELGGQLVHPDLVRGIGLLRATMFRWQRRYDASLESLDAAGRRVQSLLGLETMLGELCSMAVQVYTAYLVFVHGGTAGMMMAAYMLTGAALQPFHAIFRGWESWAFALEAWRRLRLVLRQDGAPPALPPDPAAPPGLLVEGVTFWPEGRERPILAGVHLLLSPGMVALVQGPNGVGKSTLMRLVLGLLPPSAGRVLLRGQDTHFCDRDALGARIGYLPQDVQLLEGTVYDNIGRGPDAPAGEVVAAARAAGAHEMIGRLPLGYQTPAGATSGLSAGQRRLIGLARALYGGPDLLVLDEPEVGLDRVARAAMREAVGATRRRGGVVLVVTHEPRTWLDVADVRLILGPGGTSQVQPVVAEPADEDRGASLAALG